MGTSTQALGGYTLLAFLLVVVIGVAFIPATIASRKGYSYAGFWVFGLVAFIPALLAALLISARTVDDAAGRRRCPSCDELIREAAIVCKHCGREVEAGSSDAREVHPGPDRSRSADADEVAVSHTERTLLAVLRDAGGDVRAGHGVYPDVRQLWAALDRLEEAGLAVVGAASVQLTDAGHRALIDDASEPLVASSTLGPRGDGLASEDGDGVSVEMIGSSVLCWDVEELEIESQDEVLSTVPIEDVASVQVTIDHGAPCVRISRHVGEPIHVRASDIGQARRVGQRLSNELSSSVPGFSSPLDGIATHANGDDVLAYLLEYPAATVYDVAEALELDAAEVDMRMDDLWAHGVISDISGEGSEGPRG